MPENTPQRQLEGPARLIQDNIDETALNYSRGVVSRRETLDKQYGAENVGWGIVRPEAKTSEERKDRRLGREIVKIVVTPDGDQHAQQIEVSHPDRLLASGKPYVDYLDSNEEG